MQFITGDLFGSGAEALVNTVNTVGVMGKGVALQFRERFPLNYDLYLAACRKGEVQTGKMFVTATNRMINPKWIINFPTKKHWMHKSSYAYIEAGLEDLVEQIHMRNIQSIAIPPLGTGQGGLDWGKVKELIESKLGALPIDIWVFEPGTHGTSSQAAEKTRLTKPRALILALVEQYRKLGYEISLLEVQKLAYFLQRMGQSDLKLNYKAYHYGPYAHNLQHLLHELEKGYVRGEQSMLDAKPLDLMHLNLDAAEEVGRFIEQACSPAEKNRLSKLFDLMSGYESPFGLELLSSVDWILNADKTQIQSAEEVKEKIRQWSTRKDETFSLAHIGAAKQRLQAFGKELNYAWV